MEVIARIHNDFPTKFGLPRQSGLAPSLRSKIVFEPAFRVPEALRGLEGFSHIWLIWGFSESEGWSPTVRPPRLGGNVRMGVFATRSPFRPNPIGLSSVRLEGIETDGENGLVLIVTGADLMDGTPIYDIKPYLPGVDAHPEATDGFVGAHPQTLLTVELDPSLTAALSAGQQAALREILAQDPRPAYHAGQPDSGRIYGLSYAGRDIHFTVCDGCIKAW
ncbi:MAG: tRNA (N6-threonylcarbamoyladenosine(37)-N6)-methyltransferase TrmO [Bacteroidales bacterium]|nr:tRNA (N6-threonylcarbamoyladenosine(37)-N6)-methyltransferase TrmO [Bacteroidales bacterium]